MKTYPSVLLLLPLEKPFTYAAEEAVQKGDIVTVPFGKRQLKGVVTDVKDTPPEKTAEIKAIIRREQEPPLSAEFMAFLERAGDYIMEPPGKLLHLAIGTKWEAKEKKSKEKQGDRKEPVPVILSEEQASAGEKLREKIGKGYGTTVLQGVTGSGKTEVYLEAVKKTLEDGKQVLILVPEIALINQLKKRCEDRLNLTPAIWHSSESIKNKKQAFKKMRDGTAGIVLGARSALFLPIKDIGLIVVDEEHEVSYKQEDTIVYQGRDMAVLRAYSEKVPVILASATPSLETLVNVQEGKYDKIVLSSRHENAALAEISLIDLKTDTPEKGKSLSSGLKNEIARTLEKKEQVLLFLNRKGYAPLLICKSCGHKFVCQDCSSFQVVHKKRNRLVCHYCGKSSAYPKECPACGEQDSFLEIGPGVERLFEELKGEFNHARIETLTGDDAGIESTLSRMEKGEIDILIGTQILAKGHHFPALTLVGVIDADDGLRGTDLRAAERTFQLLSQIAGRSGRDKSKPGKAFLQTALPDHPVLEAIREQDMEKFMALEIAERKRMHFPPFGKLAALVLSGTDQEAVYQAAKTLEKEGTIYKDLEILGPAAAPVFLLRGKYRFRFLVKAPKTAPLQRLLHSWLSCVKLKKSVHLKVDIDPYSFL